MRGSGAASARAARGCGTWKESRNQKLEMRNEKLENGSEEEHDVSCPYVG